MVGNISSYGFKEIVILLVLIVVALIILKSIIKFLIDTRIIDIRSISINDKWVDDIFYHYSMNIVRASYDEKGKPFKTKNGDYRVNFLNDVDKKYKEVTSQCLQGDFACEDLCRYADSRYSQLRAKDLFDLIADFRTYRKSLISENRENFLSECEELTPEEFFEIKPTIKGDIVGVYVIHNESRDMYYVGQAKRLFFRINQHLTGHGNGDVYADYKYGDDFSIKIVPLSDSGYKDIDLLEKDLIDEYHACDSGYNRTFGNG